MNSRLNVTRGAQRPRVAILPQGAISSAGQEAVELAESAGLVLDDWQRWCLDGALGERDDGNWAAFECGLIVPRQNGKGALLEARELAGLVLFGERLLVHSAHKFDTAQEHFLRMQQLVESCDDLRRKVAKIPTANGKEAIILKSGARLKFVARSRGAARGFSGDFIALDEAFNLAPETVGGMLPALSARPNPQVWYTSSAPHTDSAVLHGLRRRALNSEPGRLWFVEWGNDPGTSYDDRDAWARANPALGIRITEDFIESELAAMRDLGDEFARERLGVPSDEDSTSGVFGAGKWGVCADLASQIQTPLAIGLDVNEDQSSASFVAADAEHIELIERTRGTATVVQLARELATKQNLSITLDGRSPAASLLPELRANDVPINELPAGEFTKACAQFQRAVIEGRIKHRSQPPLDAAASSAAVRISGDSWVWARASSTVDISPLVAATIAHWAANRPQIDYANSIW